MISRLRTEPLLAAVGEQHKQIYTRGWIGLYEAEPSRTCARTSGGGSWFIPVGLVVRLEVVEHHSREDTGEHQRVLAIEASQVGVCQA